jgi:hypothetical protein
MSASARRWFTSGRPRLAISLLIHGGLIFLATAWVVSVTFVSEEEPNAFATGAGGEDAGVSGRSRPRRRPSPSAPKSLTESPPD